MVEWHKHVDIRSALCSMYVVKGKDGKSDFLKVTWITSSKLEEYCVKAILLIGCGKTMWELVEIGLYFRDATFLLTK